MINKIESALTKLRQIRPIVLCLTNYVTMDFVANCLLALGASPIMSVSDEELKELVVISNAININIGTLDHAFTERSKKAAHLAQAYNKPIVLDPVGAGATSIRTDAARYLMKYANVIKGNASEIMVLADCATQTLGVDSANSTTDAKTAAAALAHKLNTVVAVTGAEDFITNGTAHESLEFGSNLMTSVTDMGCALGAVIAAFRAVVPDSFEASRLAVCYYGLCGNLAALKTTTPGSFRLHFIDALYEGDIKAMKNLYSKEVV